MATTFTLKRKYFAEQQNEKKGASAGKKAALATVGATALAAGTALAAMRGKGNLHMKDIQNFKAFRDAAGRTFKNADTKKLDLFGKETGALRAGNLWKGVQSGAKGAANVGKQGFGKVKNWFGRTKAQGGTQA